MQAPIISLLDIFSCGLFDDLLWYASRNQIFLFKFMNTALLFHIIWIIIIWLCLEKVYKPWI